MSTPAPQPPASAPPTAPASPPTDRVVRILELLASAPDRPRSLSEIHEALGISVGTLHPLLATLVASGFLLRPAGGDKRYQLGPRLLLVGRAAAQTVPAGLAHREMQDLTEETGLTCIAVMASGRDLVIVDRTTATDDDADALTQVGRRFLFAAPLGIPLVAWQAPHERDRWLDDAPIPLDAGRRAAYDGIFAKIRARGYGIESLSAEEMRTRRTLAELPASALSSRASRMLQELLDELTVTDHALGEVADDDVLPVNVVYAPVFGANGLPILHLTLHVLRDGVPFREVRRYGELLVAATRRITDACGGHVPEAT
jgi:DNA-binding IclR family transcriptional regulator